MGPVEDKALIMRIAKKIPKTRFVLEWQVYGETCGPKRRLSFERPPGCIKFELPFGKDFSNFVIRFWAEPVEGSCDFCKAQHTVKGQSCPLAETVSKEGADLEYYGLDPRNTLDV